ncbi:hypothetical protein SDC9_139989 [bioreactor metagenome]|uniref:PD-(D/E)XK endonuclease-like domain-containing protein n=1 Tax=bioreactor metagenome TaxID=1076179 RepID=A0A645DW69_9ZZZZ
MNCRVNDLLPWPLTDEFIRVAYSPIDLQFQVYYSALGERGEFLRYALFYGLCYNRCGVRLSYVKQYGDETTEPFTLLTILGVLPEAGMLKEVKKATPFSISVSQEIAHGVKYDRYQMMDMFLCPYRYFLDYVMEDSPVVQGNFLYQKYYENILVNAVWKRIERQPQDLAMKHLKRVIAQESASIKPYFFYWKQTEIYDLENRSRNYLVYEIISKSSGTTVKPYVEAHMNIRRLFGKALFDVDISDIEPTNPYESFEVLAKRQYPRKVYSLNRLPNPDHQSSEKPQADTLRNDAKLYINQTHGNDKAAIPSEWCKFCVHRGVCMESFLLVE